MVIDNLFLCIKKEILIFVYKICVYYIKLLKIYINIYCTYNMLILFSVNLNTSMISVYMIKIISKSYRPLKDKFYLSVYNGQHKNKN